MSAIFSLTNNKEIIEEILTCCVWNVACVCMNILRGREKIIDMRKSGRQEKYPGMKES